MCTTLRFEKKEIAKDRQIRTRMCEDQTSPFVAFSFWTLTAWKQSACVKCRYHHPAGLSAMKIRILFKILLGRLNVVYKPTKTTSEEKTVACVYRRCPACHWKSKLNQGKFWISVSRNIIINQDGREETGTSAQELGPRNESCSSQEQIWTLHWLPVKEGILSKIATFVFRFFDGTLPPYL